MADLLLLGLTLTFLLMTVGFVLLCQRVEGK
jgi:hypothetical protein